jgi:aminocarboxymuconate-semialdehyde decarboxylase
MRSIDIHAHIAPGQAMGLSEGENWHGFIKEEVSGRNFLNYNGKRYWLHPSYSISTEERLAQMDAVNVDVHVLSTWTQLYNYDLPAEVGTRTCRDANDWIVQTVKDNPQRFSGLATLPMQDVGAAVTELERAMGLGLKGAQINDHVNGRTLEEAEFNPFWEAAEKLGALIFFHQVENDTMIEARTDKYTLGNAIGNLADRSVTFATLVFGGVMDKYPDLKVCFAHGGGYACFGAGRMDRGWQVRSEARVNINEPPSQYLDRFYYDCLTHSEEVLRFMIDSAGIDRIFLGSDWPYDMGIDSPVEWVNSLKSLTQEEKEAILWKNLEGVLGI